MAKTCNTNDEQDVELMRTVTELRKFLAPPEGTTITSDIVDKLVEFAARTSWAAVCIPVFVAL